MIAFIAEGVNYPNGLFGNVRALVKFVGDTTCYTCITLQISL